MFTCHVETAVTTKKTSVPEDFDSLGLSEIERFMTEEKRPAVTDAHVVLAGASSPADTSHTIRLTAPELAEGKGGQAGSAAQGPAPAEGGAGRTKLGIVLGAALLLGLLLWLVWSLGR